MNKHGVIVFQSYSNLQQTNINDASANVVIFDVTATFLVLNYPFVRHFRFPLFFLAHIRQLIVLYLMFILHLVTLLG